MAIAKVSGIVVDKIDYFFKFKRSGVPPIKNMTALDNIRNEIIEKLLTINDENKLLDFLIQIEDKDNTKEANTLTERKRKSILKGLDDLSNGRFISDEEAFKQDLEWLKTQ